MSSLKVSARLEYEKLAVNKKNVVHLLVSLEGLPILKSDRKGLHVAAMIDVSGSMGYDGNKKIEYAKKSVRRLIKHLTSQDTFALGAFSTNVWTIIPPTKMTAEAKLAARSKVDELHPMDSTNFSGALLETFEHVKSADASIVRSIVFTDGCPTTGETDPGKIMDLLARMPERASLSAFGFGMDVNKELLTSIAKKGGGNYFFINNPDEILSNLGHELGGLVTCAAQKIKVKVTVPHGVKILEVYGDFDVDADNKDRNWATISVDDVYSEEIRKVLLRLELPETSSALAARPLIVAGAKVEFFDLGANEVREEEVTAKAQYVKDGEEQKDRDQDVWEQIIRFEAVKAQEEAMKFAAQGKWKEAQNAFAGVFHMASGAISSGAVCMMADLKANLVPALANDEMYKMSGGAHYLHSHRESYAVGRAHTKGTSDVFGTELQRMTSKSFEEDDVAPLVTITQTVRINPAPAPVVNKPVEDTPLKKERKEKS